MGFGGDRLGMALTVELPVPGQPFPDAGLCDELFQVRACGSQLRPDATSVPPGSFQRAESGAEDKAREAFCPQSLCQDMAL